MTTMALNATGGFLRRIALLLAGTFGTAGLAFITHLLLTRAMSLSDYGRIVALLAAVNLFTPITSMGMGWFWLDLFGREGRQAIRWMGRATRLACASTAVSVLLLVTYAVATDPQGAPHTYVVSLLLIPILVGQALSDSTSARLQLEERYLMLAAWQALAQLGRTLFAVILLFWGRVEMLPLLGTYAMVGTLSMVISIISLGQTIRGNIRLVGHDTPGDSSSAARPVFATQPAWGELLSHALPYSLITFCFVLSHHGTVSMVAAILGSADAAIYNVAYLVYALVCLVPNVTYVKFLSSKLLRWWHQDRRMFDAVFHVGLVAHLVMGIVCALLLGGVAPWLLPLVFGERYAVSSPLIMILALGIPVRFVQHAYGSLLFSKDHIRRKLAYMSSAGVASVGLNIALIPSLGIRGAALGAVLTELMLLLVYMWGVAKHVEGIQVRDSFRIETLRSAFGYVRGQRS